MKFANIRDYVQKKFGQKGANYIKEQLKQDMLSNLEEKARYRDHDLEEEELKKEAQKAKNGNRLKQLKA